MLIKPIDARLGIRRMAFSVSLTVFVVLLFRGFRKWITREEPVVSRIITLLNPSDRMPLKMRALTLAYELLFRAAGMYKGGEFSRQTLSLIEHWVSESNVYRKGIYSRDFTIEGCEGNEFDPRAVPDLVVRVCNSTEFPEKEISDHEIESVPVVLYLHGGAFVMGSSRSREADFICSKFARKGFVVVSGDYRKSPENSFPGAVEDAYRVLEWTVNGEFLPLRANPSRIILVGTGSGGGLVSVLSSLARDRLNGELSPCEIRHDFEIEHQVIIYGNLFHNQLSKNSNQHNPFLPKEVSEWCEDAYLPEGIREDAQSDRRYSPWLAGLHDLPPTTVISAKRDPYFDENNLYADRLKALGAFCNHYSYNDFHGFMTLGCTDNSEIAFQAIFSDLEGRAQEQEVERERGAQKVE